MICLKNPSKEFKGYLSLNDSVFSITCFGVISPEFNRGDITL